MLNYHHYSNKSQLISFNRLIWGISAYIKKGEMSDGENIKA
jgi:hypothetical protein